jgi:hypothetical protein
MSEVSANSKLPQLRDEKAEENGARYARLSGLDPYGGYVAGAKCAFIDGWDAHHETLLTMPEAAFDSEVDRQWFRDQGFIRQDKDEFKSTTTFQSVAKAMKAWQYSQNQAQIAALKLENQRLNALNKYQVAKFSLATEILPRKLEEISNLKSRVAELELENDVLKLEYEAIKTGKTNKELSEACDYYCRMWNESKSRVAELEKAAIHNKEGCEKYER